MSKWVTALGAALIALFATHGSAKADLGGMYFGLNFGISSGSIEWTRPNGTPVNIPADNSVNAGIIVGRDFPISQRFSAGVEFGYSPQLVGSATAFCNGAGRQCTSSMENAVTLGGRIGIAGGERMTYTFGLGYVNGEVNTNRWRTAQGPAGPAARTSDTRLDGAYLGLGLLFDFPQQGRVGVELRRYEFNAGSANIHQNPARTNTNIDGGITALNIRYEMLF